MLWTHSHMVIAHYKCCCDSGTLLLVLCSSFCHCSSTVNCTDIIVHKSELCLTNCWVWVSVPPGPPFFFSSSAASVVILILSGSSTSWAALIWQHGSLSWLDTQEALHCAVPWLWCTVQRHANGFLLWLAFRGLLVFMSPWRFMGVISTEKLVSVVCTTCVHPHSEQISKSSSLQQSSFSK